MNASEKCDSCDHDGHLATNCPHFTYVRGASADERLKSPDEKQASRVGVTDETRSLLRHGVDGTNLLCFYRSVVGSLQHMKHAHRPATVPALQQALATSTVRVYGYVCMYGDVTTRDPVYHMGVH